jgi:ppGpp synthetase/RelA/SpoT-type nucleotidyltranferase
MERPFPKVDAAVASFAENREVFTLLAQTVQAILERMLVQRNITYYRIVSRVKDVESFKAKAHRYENPLSEIDDLAGVRVITYVEEDSKEVAGIVEELFAVDKERSADKKVSLGVDRVGYRATHYVAELTADRTALPEYRIFDGYRFEIQIQTLLQHTWTEIEHDRQYKFHGAMPDDLRRRFLVLAGSLELADNEFSRLVKDCQPYLDSAAEGLPDHMLHLALDDNTLHQYLHHRFGSLIKRGIAKDNYGQDDIWGYDLAMNVVEYGITTVMGFHAIVPEKLEEAVLHLHSQSKYFFTNLRGLVFDTLTTHDLERYMTRVRQQYGPLDMVDWDTAAIWRFCGRDNKKACAKFGLKIRRKPPN